MSGTAGAAAESIGPTTVVDTVVLRERIAALRARSAEPVELERELTPALRCAATLSHFSPYALLDAFALTPDARTLQALADECVPGTESTWDGYAAPRWTLSLASRQRVLREVDVGELRAARSRVHVDASDTLQRMADELLSGREINPRTLSAGELAALIEARAWFDGILRPLPEAQTLRAGLAMARLLEPMERLVGDHFVGRTAELERLADYVGVLPPSRLLGIELLGRARRFVRKTWRTLREHPPLYVAGPGGVGKSSLLARFILQHVREASDDPLPFVLLDFDRAQIEPTLPLTLLVAALQQLSVQFPTGAGEMARMSERLLEVMRGVDSANFHGMDSLQGALVSEFAQRVDELVGGAGSSTPLLWVLDTFEEPQRLGESTVGPLWELMNTLQQSLPRLRLVVCGRVVPPGFEWDVVSLNEFDEPSARAFLRRRLLLIGASDAFSDAMVDSVIGAVGLSPLALRLAARLMAEQDPQLLTYRARDARVQAMLFHRVLEHIRVHPSLGAFGLIDSEECAQLQRELSRLVYPGLEVRRITPGVIEHVLAEPCGVTIRDGSHALRLFLALRQQVDIVDVADDDASADGPSLVHRTDVRRMMMSDLEHHAGEETIRQIDRRAVRYLFTLSSDASRAEEIYHRLRLKQSEATVRSRWLPGLERYLYGAMEEFTAPADRQLLADLLGVTLDAASLANARLDQWERQALRRVRQYLASANPTRALAVLEERRERSAGSPLLIAEAQAQQMMGNFSRAARCAQDALAAAERRGDRIAACEAGLQLALADEAMGMYDNAHAEVLAAEAHAVQMNEPLLELVALCGLRRISRKSRGFEGEPQESSDRDARLERLLKDTQVRTRLRGRRALLREVLAELGAREPRLLQIGIDVLGVDLPSPEEAETLARVLVDWIRPMSGDAKERVRELLLAAQVPTGPDSSDLFPPVTEWAAWLWTRSGAEIGRLLLAMMRAVPASEALQTALASLYQREVDRVILRRDRPRAV